MDLNFLPFWFPILFSYSDFTWNKIGPRAEKCLFFGFKHGTKGGILFDLITRGIFISRNVIFMNLIFHTLCSLSCVISLFFPKHYMFALATPANCASPTHPLAPPVTLNYLTSSTPLLHMIHKLLINLLHLSLILLTIV